MLSDYAPILVLFALVIGFAVGNLVLSELVGKKTRAIAKGSAYDFVEVYVDASLETCESRDVKGLYAKARAGEIPEFTGISAPYEPPERPELVLDTNRQSVEESVIEGVSSLERKGYLSPPGER